MSECKECGKKFKTTRGLATHLRFYNHGMTFAKYQEKHNPRKCIECGNVIKYKDKYHQYVFCSKKCQISNFKKRDPPLNAYDRKYNEEQLLNILRDLHTKYKGFITQKLVKSSSQVNHQIYYDYFGSFSAACEKAGVPHFKQLKQPSENEPKKITPFTIIIDTREQKPYRFENSIRMKLDYGDYKSQDLFNGVIFERKSLGDFRSTLSSQRDRFSREMQRAREANHYVLIIIDATLEQLFKTKAYGKLSAKAILHFMKEFESQNADVCQFVFTGSREKSKQIISNYFNLTPDDMRCLDFQNIVDSVSDLKYDVFSDKYIFGEETK